MKILQVTSVLTPDGAFGGPVRVAVNQATALSDLGHDVTLCAASSGFTKIPTKVDGVPVKSWPARTASHKAGYSGLVSLRLLLWILFRAERFDVVHVHLSRDLITLPAAWLATLRGVPVIVQSHGMVMPSTRRSARRFDSLLTRRVLRRAHICFYSTEDERTGLNAVAGDHQIALLPVPNGVPVSAPRLGGTTDVPTVLFLARLHPRKNPVMFVEAAAGVLDDGVSAEFVLVGPDEGEAAAVRRAIDASGHADSIRWDGSISPADTIDRMRGADLYVLPSHDEAYPMTVLEAMSVGLPVIVTDSCGLAPFVGQTEAGLLIDATVDDLADAIERLVRDDTARKTMGRNALVACREQHSMDTVAHRLETTYVSVRRAVDP